jgi:hypothetical protein
MAGQLANEINILTKLVWFGMNQERAAAKGVPKEAALSQTLLLIKILAGKLYEGHALIGKAFSAKKLYQKYQNRLRRSCKAPACPGRRAPATPCRRALAPIGSRAPPFSRAPRLWFRGRASATSHSRAGQPLLGRGRSPDGLRACWAISISRGSVGGA